MLIGYERKNRIKEAVIRTHFVAAVGATLVMIVSSMDSRIRLDGPKWSYDPSKIAAQVVSGVGFIGARGSSLSVTLLGRKRSRSLDLRQNNKQAQTP